MSKRIIYYYQTFVGLKKILEQKPICVTHIIVSSIHFGYTKNKPYIHLNNNDPLIYKKFKAIKVTHYLKISSKFSNFFIRLVSFLEIPLSLFILLFNFIKYSFRHLISSSKRVTNQKLMFGFYSEKLSDTDIDLTNITIVEIPSIKANYPDCEKISIFDGIDKTIPS